MACREIDQTLCEAAYNVGTSITTCVVDQGNHRTAARLLSRSTHVFKLSKLAPRWCRKSGSRRISHAHRHRCGAHSELRQTTNQTCLILPRSNPNPAHFVTVSLPLNRSPTLLFLLRLPPAPSQAISPNGNPVPRPHHLILNPPPLAMTTTACLQVTPRRASQKGGHSRNAWLCFRVSARLVEVNQLLLLQSPQRSRSGNRLLSGADDNPPTSPLKAPSDDIVAALSKPPPPAEEETSQIEGEVSTTGEEQVDPEEEERQRRAAIAARMARLGVRGSEWVRLSLVVNQRSSLSLPCPRPR
ncbi:hypothetical protein BGW80DRAFT_475004 [Lactifluus volemus]|nr:hypothetical protein BGW80DRAFT_475004 [Lactifluus volemus]